MHVQSAETGRRNTVVRLQLGIHERGGRCEIDLGDAALDDGREYLSRHRGRILIAQGKGRKVPRFAIAVRFGGIGPNEEDGVARSGVGEGGGHTEHEGDPRLLEVNVRRLTRARRVLAGDGQEGARDLLVAHEEPFDLHLGQLLRVRRIAHRAQPVMKRRPDDEGCQLASISRLSDALSTEAEVIGDVLDIGGRSLVGVEQGELALVVDGDIAAMRRFLHSNSHDKHSFSHQVDGTVL